MYGSVAPVAIVGAGPAGKVLSLELAHRGIPSVLIDEGSGVPREARARLTSARSMEHFRRLGLARNVRAARMLPADYPVNVVYATRLTGSLLHFFPEAYGSGDSELFAEGSQHIPQHRLEQVLCDAVTLEPSITCFFGWRADSLTQDDEVATVRIVHCGSGRKLTIAARYLVGCDGAHSTIRNALGIGLRGSSAAQSAVGVELRAPSLGEVIREGGLPKATQYWLINRDAPGLISALNAADRWTLLLPGTEVPEDVSSYARRAAGADLAVQILDIVPWTAHQLQAEHYRVGRVFLAGDAAHQHPPYGGYGMNIGIGDAVDLGWKLAAREAGWGGAGLLASYMDERFPVHRWAIEQAVRNVGDLPSDLVHSPDLEADSASGRLIRARLGAAIAEHKTSQHVGLGVTLGYRYDGSPIVFHDGSTPPPLSATCYVPSSRPGGRAPHAWLAEGDSLFDHFGAWFTLISFDVSAPTEIVAAARAVGIPLATLRIDNRAIAELYERRYVLIRPDQHVAWRGDDVPADVAGMLNRVVGRSGGQDTAN